MTRRSIITRTATIALGAAALAAPAASARPADMPPAVAKAATAGQHKQAQRSSDVGDYPTRSSHGHGKRAAVVPVHKVAGVPAGEHVGASFAAGYEESESAPPPPPDPCALVRQGRKQALFLGQNGETVTCTVDRRTQLIVFGAGAGCSDVELAPFFGADEAAQRACAIAFDMEFVQALRVSVDGGTPVDIHTPRFEVISPQMTAQVPADSPFGYPEGTATLVAHAWIAEVRKLRPGRHTIEAQSVTAEFDITSTLIVNIRRNGHG